jgi:hypothetical protein
LFDHAHSLFDVVICRCKPSHGSIHELTLARVSSRALIHPTSCSSECRRASQIALECDLLALQTRCREAPKCKPLLCLKKNRRPTCVKSVLECRCAS